jgi:hypothetical protein
MKFSQFDILLYLRSIMNFLLHFDILLYLRSIMNLSHFDILLYLRSIMNTYAFHVTKLLSRGRDEWLNISIHAECVVLHLTIIICRSNCMLLSMLLCRVENCRQAMVLAKDHLNIPRVISAEDFANPALDELSAMTYLSYFVKPNSPGYYATLNWVCKQLKILLYLRSIMNLLSHFDILLYLRSIMNLLSHFDILPYLRSIMNLSHLDILLYWRSIMNLLPYFDILLYLRSIMNLSHFYILLYLTRPLFILQNVLFFI